MNFKMNNRLQTNSSREKKNDTQISMFPYNKNTNIEQNQRFVQIYRKICMHNVKCAQNNDVNSSYEWMMLKIRQPRTFTFSSQTTSKY